MRSFSLFLLPLVVGMGVYFAISIFLPSLNPLFALFAALVSAWALRSYLKRLPL